MIGHGDTVFRTLLGLSQAALRWLPSRCRKTSVSRQGHSSDRPIAVLERADVMTSTPQFENIVHVSTVRG
jgi:hypothetical protein